MSIPYANFDAHYFQTLRNRTTGFWNKRLIFLLVVPIITDNEIGNGIGLPKLNQQNDDNCVPGWFNHQERKIDLLNDYKSNNNSMLRKLQLHIDKAYIHLPK